MYRGILELKNDTSILRKSGSFTNTIPSTLKVASTRPDADICDNKMTCLNKLCLTKNLMWVDKLDPHSKMIQMKKKT